jgi:uncharacterized protein YbjT (DUF2867 family)
MEANSGSPVQQLFQGAGVFVTGGTGFVGKLLLEKLLRACPGVRIIFLLMRPKNGKSEAERFDELFGGMVSWTADRRMETRCLLRNGNSDCLHCAMLIFS